jgi:hypothetical protein
MSRLQVFRSEKALPADFILTERYGDTRVPGGRRRAEIIEKQEE